MIASGTSGEGATGRVGDWGHGRVGEWAKGRMGEWAKGLVGEWGSREGANTYGVRASWGIAAADALEVMWSACVGYLNQLTCTQPTRCAP